MLPWRGKHFEIWEWQNTLVTIVAKVIDQLSPFGAAVHRGQLGVCEIPEGRRAL